MGLNDTAKNAMLDHLATLITHIGLHSADPGTTGTSELTGGTPAYARKAITWAAAAAGVLSKDATALVFDVEGGDTVAFVGFWGALTVGTFYGSADVTDEVFGSQGTYTLTDADISVT